LAHDLSENSGRADADNTEVIEPEAGTIAGA
jgi:hypothetical protein